MTREEAIEKLELMRQKVDEETYRALILAIKALEQEPTSEMVHVETLHQVMWERDIAIEQLKELGYSFGQKIEPCDDAISRILKRMWNCRGKHTTSIDKVAMEQIIRDELSVTQKPIKCDDAISREAVLKLKHHKPEYGDMIYAFDVEQLPSVTQKSGKWIEGEEWCETVGGFERWGNDYTCSECGLPLGRYTLTDYCPNCGADMRGVE